MEITRRSTMTTCLLIVIGSIAISSTSFVHVRNRRSFGGEIAKIKDYPFMASLRRSYSSHFCGGSIIAKKWILTASHCVDNEFPEEVEVAVGTDIVGDDRKYLHSVQQLYAHPNFSSSIQQLKHDIALVELTQPLNFSETIQPIKLGKIPLEAVLGVKSAGWGRIKEGRAVRDGDQLRYLEMTTLSTKPCQIIHAIKNNTVDGDTQICAIAAAGKSLCSGDSGAPLIDLATKRVVGVFSGFETCTGEFPTLHARVESYIDWINSVTKENFTLESTGFLTSARMAPIVTN